jgi:hypothetical protein
VAVVGVAVVLGFVERHAPLDAAPQSSMAPRHMHTHLRRFVSSRSYSCIFCE